MRPASSQSLERPASSANPASRRMTPRERRSPPPPSLRPRDALGRPLPAVALGYTAAPKPLAGTLLPNLDTAFRPATPGSPTAAAGTGSEQAHHQQQQQRYQHFNAPGYGGSRPVTPGIADLGTTVRSRDGEGTVQFHEPLAARPASVSAGSGAATPRERVSLAERMAGSRLRRRPPDAGQLATAMLVGGARVDARGLPPRASTPGAFSSSSATVQQHQTKPPRFQRACCTPGPDDDEARRGAALEALLTAGEYEDAYRSGREEAAFEEERYELSDAVRGLRGFDRELRAAKRAEDEQRRLQREQDAADAADDSPAGSTKPYVPPSTAKAFAPPRVIQLVFRLGTVKNLTCVAAFRRIGYPELHEQFSVAASSAGVLYRQQYLDVLAKYLTAHEHADSLRVFDCFTQQGHADVELPILLVGLQMLLECATPGDTLRYCFQLMDQRNQVPRYMTRFEAQTLVMNADEAAKTETVRQLRAQGRDVEAEFMTEHELVEACGDRAYLAMRQAILGIVNDPSRYDACGRMPLGEFVAELEAKINAIEAQEALWSRARTRTGGTAVSSAAASTSGAPSANNSRSATQQQQQQRGSKPRSRSSSVAAPKPAGLSTSATADSSPARPNVTTPTTRAMPGESPFVFGRAWQGGAALMHRMSSKKMIIASLAPGAPPPGVAGQSVLSPAELLGDSMLQGSSVNGAPAAYVRRMTALTVPTHDNL